MRTRTVRTPVGPTFDVAVRWAPRWARVFRRARRRHRRSREGADVAFDGVGELAGGGLDDLGGVVVWIVGAVAFVFGVLLVWLFLVPLLLVVLDLIVVVVVLVVAFLGRLLLRRPWTVAVTPAGDDDTPVALADVMGWNRALRVRDAIGERLAAGASPEQAVLDVALGDKAVTARVAGSVSLRG